MNRIISLFVFLIISYISYAQASDGQIRRKNTTSATVKKQKKPNLPPNSVKLDDGTIVQYETTRAVDLGLPSGTIWAGWNIGANSPLEVGSYYAWGETEEKVTYDWNTYFDIKSIQKNIYGEYENPTFLNFYVNGIMSIIGTEHDVAKAKWGATWKMPTKVQLEELVRECEVHRVKMGGGENKYNFVLFKGPNGKCIVFPISGKKNKSETSTTFGELCWSGELRPYAEASAQNSYFAYHLGDYRVYSEGFRCYGLNVRAVMK